MTVREQMQEIWEKIVEKGYNNYSCLDKNERIWFNVESAITGGLVDHYINFGAEHNSELIEDLEYLGFSDASKLFREINVFFNKGVPPVDIDIRNEEIYNWDHRKRAILDQNEEIFWSITDDIEKALHEHLSKSF